MTGLTLTLLTALGPKVPLLLPWMLLCYSV